MFLADDENGDVLRRMIAKGDDLTVPRNIDFSVLFAEQNSAEKFAEHLRSLGYEVSVKGEYPNPDFPMYSLFDTCPHLTRASLTLKTCCIPSRTVGEGVTTAGAVFLDRGPDLRQNRRS